MKRQNKLTPLLLGGDLNAYSTAVAFHDAFGVVSYAMGKYKCGLTSYSRIVKNVFRSGFQSIDILLPEIFSFCERHKGENIVLVPCADIYVEFINEHREELSRVCRFIVPNRENLSLLTNKAEFYKLLARFGIPYPISHKLTVGNMRELDSLAYPAVLKPSLSAEYWKHPFPRMKKVYYPKTSREARETANRIFESGYSASIVLQEKIENPEIFVYTAFIYSGKRCFGVFGRVVLEECGETSSGNHSAIITVEPNELTEKLDAFLMKIGYSGIANFDILYSSGRYYVLELNARQGRSCDYLRASGVNFARHLCEALGVSPYPCQNLSKSTEGYRQVLWHYPGFSVTLKYIEEEGLKRLGRRLYEVGEEFSALDYPPDLRFNPLRKAYVKIHERRLALKLKSDFEKQRESLSEDVKKSESSGIKRRKAGMEG